MPVELRSKRKAAEPAPAPPPKKKNPIDKAVAKVKEVKKSTSGPATAKTNGSTSAKVAVGQNITLEGFGGEVETNDGQKTSLNKLVDESKAGVVLFTYPKASTPGCIKQACLFKDSYTPLTATGFSIFGLSMDSPKSNTSFKEKQKLPYALLCDPSATLISAIGMKKSAKSTTRGVFVVDKTGKVLAAEPGAPAATVEVVKKLVESSGAPAPATEKADVVAEEPKAEETKTANGVNGVVTNEDVAKANIAAEVADTAEKLDSSEAPPA